MSLPKVSSVKPAAEISSARAAGACRPHKLRFHELSRPAVGVLRRVVYDGEHEHAVTVGTGAALTRQDGLCRPPAGPQVSRGRPQDLCPADRAVPRAVMRVAFRGLLCIRSHRSPLWSGGSFQRYTRARGSAGGVRSTCPVRVQGDARGGVTAAHGAPPARGPYCEALPLFSATLSSTIRRIRSVGSGRPRGNCTEPFPLL